MKRLTNTDLAEKTARKRRYRKVRKAARAPAGSSIERSPAEISCRESVSTAPFPRRQVERTENSGHPFGQPLLYVHFNR